MSKKCLFIITYRTDLYNIIPKFDLKSTKIDKEGRKRQ